MDEDVDTDDEVQKECRKHLAKDLGELYENVIRRGPNLFKNLRNTKIIEEFEKKRKNKANQQD